MIKKICCCAVLLCSFLMSGQIVINELDTDTPGTDDKEFIEIKSAVPNFPLDNYVLVLFNGSASSSTGNKSYFAMDLDGFVTDVNGLLVIGNDLVSPVPDEYLQVSTIQNGADGIAIYFGSEADFPDQTLATTTNLIDALVYDTSDADATELMALLGASEQINEDANGLGTTQSIQRKNDGTYETKNPTPGVNNDGTGILFNGVAINVAAGTYNEGDNFNITFNTQSPVTSDLSFTYSLNSGSFNAADYTANLNVLIPEGSNSFTTNVGLNDDSTDDGDELAKIKFGALPIGFKRLNNNVEIRVIDNDFTTLPWGTPLNPTYGNVSSTAPTGYYDSLEGKSGAELKQAIQDIIANPAVVHAQNYGDIEYILKESDQNPQNSNEVWLMYVEQGRAKYKYQNTASNVGSWNREHIYPQSRGGFSDGTDSNSDGINNWNFTNADDINAGHGDAHHIRAEDGPENTRRSNKDYGLDDYNGPLAGTQGSWHGDVARALFYMGCRYNALSLVNGNPPDTAFQQLGDLATLIQWNHSDPRDDFEMHRNNVIYTWQVNRNPFIDYPDLADYVYGANIGQVWHAALAEDVFSGLNVFLYPNPATDRITISGLEDKSHIDIYGVSGVSFYTADFAGTTNIELQLATGMYFARITSGGRSTIMKLIIK